MSDLIKIRVEFGGGTELLFDKQKLIELELPAGEQQWTISKLIQHLSSEHIKERVELFSNGGKIRPGILVLVNEVDYEIVGGHDYVIKNGDSILFISTLHGG